MASLFRPAAFPRAKSIEPAEEEAAEPAGLSSRLAKAAPFLQAAGTVMSVLSNERGAKADERQLRKMAGDERASSQRAAAEERRRSRLAQSRARAVAASSGAGVDDPTVQNIMADLEAEGEYRALTRMYEGETSARSMELEGKERRRAARGRSIATVLSGTAQTFASKYG